MNVVNARYGTAPGAPFYTHLTDQYGPHHVALIPATAHEAPYVLDGPLLAPSGRRLQERYTNTGGLTDHLFAISAILGFRFAPRIRDLADRRLYAFTPAATCPELAPMIAGRIDERLIHARWPDILRLAASMSAGVRSPGCRGALISRDEEDAPWRQVFTAQPERRREFEPSSKRRERRPAPRPPATG